MNTPELFSTMRRMRVIIVLLALLLAYGAISYSPQAATPNEVHSIDLGGVTGATNNTILAYGRFVLVAPFWPSTGIAENGDLDLSLLNNDSLYVIDTSKPNSAPISKRLSSRDSTVYFPTRIVFDPKTNNVLIRGTRFNVKDGEITPVDVIAWVRLDLDDNGKAVFDTNVVSIDIQGEGESNPNTSDAPLDFSFGGHGDLMVFTNGASVFSANLAEGYLNKIQIIKAGDYGASDSISFLDVDPDTNIVSICENQRWVGKDKVARVSSRLSFYRLGEHGQFDLLKQTEPGLSPDGAALADGSNITIISDADSETALFVTNDGSLSSVDLSGTGVSGTVKQLWSFPELALASVAAPNPLLIQYDSAKRAIGIVKPGFTTQISRPTNGKPGKISRPTNLHIMSEAPVLAMAKLSKKNKVTAAKSFSDDFKDEGGLANFVKADDSQWLISTYSGKLFSVKIAAGLQDSQLELIDSMGSRVDRIDYYGNGSGVVAISAFTLDEGGIRMAAPGSLVFGRMFDLQSQGASAVQALLPTASMLGRSTPTIRRPCNIKR